MTSFYSCRVYRRYRCAWSSIWPGIEVRIAGCSSGESSRVSRCSLRKSQKAFLQEKLQIPEEMVATVSVMFVYRMRKPLKPL
jgi:hypothetical protein